MRCVSTKKKNQKGSELHNIYGVFGFSNFPEEMVVTSYRLDFADPGSAHSRSGNESCYRTVYLYAVLVVKDNSSQLTNSRDAMRCVSTKYKINICLKRY